MSASSRNKFLVSLTVLFAGMQGISLAQHHGGNHAQTEAKKSPMHFEPVMSQALKDPDLKGYNYNVSTLELAPGLEDTVAHRHDAELFVYVLEGSVQTQLDRKPIQTYTKGQMFYEYPNVLHSYLKNGSTTQPAKLLLAFIIKDGRQGYKREYPPVGGK